MRRVLLSFSSFLVVLLVSSPSTAQELRRLVTAAVDESALISLGGNTPPAASRSENDRGAVADGKRFEPTPVTGRHFAKPSG